MVLAVFSVKSIEQLEDNFFWTEHVEYTKAIGTMK